MVVVNGCYVLDRAYGVEIRIIQIEQCANTFDEKLLEISCTVVT